MSALHRARAAAVAGALLMGALSAPGSGLETIRFLIAVPVGTFERDRSVPLRVTLVNVSTQPVRVNARLAVNDQGEPQAFREVTIAIRTPSGRPAAFRLDIKIRAAAEKDFVTLAPGRSISKTIDLHRYYALVEPGTYEARATYTGGHDWKPPVRYRYLAPVSGPIESNTIRFTLR
jgi:hypothetical protein